MKSQLFDVAVLGGDERLEYMAGYLKQAGKRVITYAMDIERHCTGCNQAMTLKEAMESASVIICPIPVSRDGVKIIAAQEKPDMLILSFLKYLRSEHIVFGGCIPDIAAAYCYEKDIECIDFMKEEEIAVFNSIATAEGAIAEAIRNHPGNLHGSECLITGYGRCAKTLAHKLAGMSANVTVCARNADALAQAAAYGYQTVPLPDLIETIGKYTYIFNTIPSKILGAEALRHIKKETLLMDIAPGGFDLEEALSMGVHARKELGLPGRFAPAISAKKLTDFVIKKVEKEKD